MTESNAVDDVSPTTDAGRDGWRWHGSLYTVLLSGAGGAFLIVSGAWGLGVPSFRKMPAFLSSTMMIYLLMAVAGLLATARRRPSSASGRIRSLCVIAGLAAAYYLWLMAEWISLGRGDDIFPSATGRSVVILFGVPWAIAAATGGGYFRPKSHSAGLGSTRLRFAHRIIQSLLGGAAILSLWLPMSELAVRSAVLPMAGAADLYLRSADHHAGRGADITASRTSVGLLWLALVVSGVVLVGRLVQTWSPPTSWPGALASVTAWRIAPLLALASLLAYQRRDLETARMRSET